MRALTSVVVGLSCTLIGVSLLHLDRTPPPKSCDRLSFSTTLDPRPYVSVGEQQGPFELRYRLASTFLAPPRHPLSESADCCHFETVSDGYWGWCGWYPCRKSREVSKRCCNFSVVNMTCYGFYATYRACCPGSTQPYKYTGACLGGGSKNIGPVQKCGVSKTSGNCY
jgi:hypothetical protein